MIAPGKTVPGGAIEIPTTTAVEAGLVNGMHLPTEAVEALVSRDLAEFVRLVEPQDKESIREARRTLPSSGHWEYRVELVSEMGGFGTAKGTAERMTSILNALAVDGWELVSTSERDNRFLGGESVLLTLRRYVTTVAEFRLRYETEELIRREILGRLDVAVKVEASDF